MDNPDRSDQGLLLRSLAELVPPDEFQEVIKNSEINPTSKKSYGISALGSRAVNTPLKNPSVEI